MSKCVSAVEEKVGLLAQAQVEYISPPLRRALRPA